MLYSSTMREWIKRFISLCRRTVRYKIGPWSTGALAIIGGGAMLTAPTTAAFGWASIVVGTLLLLWGVRINGMHLLKPWWRGRPSPFRVTAGVSKFDYAHGSVVAGIPWERGFAHVWVRIRNEAAQAIDNVDALLAPEYPIIRSNARCDFAQCRIAPLHGQPTVSIVYEINGVEFAQMAGEDPGLPASILICPAHRMHCDKLPSGAEIDIDLATVVRAIPPPPEDKSVFNIWKIERTDPTGIRVRIHWSEDGYIYGVEHLLDLKGGDHEKRP